MNTALLRSPFFADLVMALVGVALTLGWFEISLPEGSGWLVGAFFFALWIGEHFAFAHRTRSSLLRLHSRMPNATAQEFGDAVPSSYGLFVGAILRAALRVMPLGAGLMAVGLFAPSRKEELPIWVTLPLMTGELVFAAYWLFGPMTGTSNRQSGKAIRKGKSAASKPDHHAPAESWLRRQLDRARRASPAANSAAELLLLAWSCLLFAFISSFFADDMARWSSRPDPMPPLVLLPFLVFATAMLALVLHIPLHLDSWFDRAIAARTRGGRWRLRISAWFAMAAGLGPAWVAYWNYCRP